MHEVQGVFCKTGKLWIIAKIRRQGKTLYGAKLRQAQQKKTKGGALWVASPMGFGPFEEEGLGRQGRCAGPVWDRGVAAVHARVNGLGQFENCSTQRDAEARSGNGSSPDSGERRPE